MKRRDFLAGSGGVLASTAAFSTRVPPAVSRSAGSGRDRAPEPCPKGRAFNESYENEYLNRIAFPLGGMGAGMVCLEGSGALTNVSLRHQPDLKNEPLMFAALAIQGAPALTRVLEGPVPGWKAFLGASIPAGGVCPYGGYPRFRHASFQARFPFAAVSLADQEMPFEVRISGWSPFEPGDADSACLPVAALEYTFTNRSSEAREAIFSFHARNFMAGSDLFRRAKVAPINAIRSTPGGYVLSGATDADDPWDAGALALWTDDPAVKVNHAWPVSEGGTLWTLMWRMWGEIRKGACYERPPLKSGPTAPGASLFVPFRLEPGATKTLKLRLAWYVGRSHVRTGDADPKSGEGKETYKPWYAGRFADLAAVKTYWDREYERLRANTERFTRCFYDSTLPPEALEAVAANLSILKSPTVLRQTDGRLWGWEGCIDTEGYCPGSCTHVWNFAQALAHLFPSLERTLRETEFGPSQRPNGQQTFRAAIPIRPPEPSPFNDLAAADGQLGGIVKVYREWRISGDTDWLREMWPKVRTSLDFCIRTWDPKRKGWPEEPQQCGFDVWLWGPNGMTASLYVGALKAATLMGEALGEDTAAYATLLKQGVRRLETELFNGEYFHQQVEWRTLKAKFPNPDVAVKISAAWPGASSWIGNEFLDVAEQEGPHQQYGNGCLANGINGAWMAWACGVGDVLDVGKVKSHLRAVHRYNFKPDLSGNFNPCRSAYAVNREGGVLICTWPKGDAHTIPLMYAGETWTGVEYEVASHLIARGMVEEGLEVVRAVRTRHDGRTRNPFDEMEAGHWYARAMASYALLQALSGARYDAVDKVLYLKPALKGDFRCFLSTATGYGTVGIKDGQPFVEVVAGKIPYSRIEYTAS